MRLRGYLFALLGLAGFGLNSSPALAQGQPANTCSTETGQTATVREIDERFELTLDNGMRLRLSGIEPPHGTPTNPRVALDARDRLQAWLVGREVAFTPLAKAPDRWGRMEANVSALDPSGGPRLSVAEMLLDAGLGRALPEAGARACLAGLLKHEETARAGRLGVWADPAYSILAASDRKAFADRGGEIVVVEGAVVGTGETRWRTYVNFGPIRTVDFAVTLGRQSLKLFETLGLRPAEFTGQRLRVRGQLDTRFGPQIDIIEPSAIEFLTAAGLSPHSRPVARR